MLSASPIKVFTTSVFATGPGIVVLDHVGVAPCHKWDCYFPFLKSRRVTIRGAQPSARLSEEICLSEGSAGVSQRALRGLSEGSAGSLRGSAGVRGIFRGFRGLATLCLWPSGAVTYLDGGNSANFRGLKNTLFEGISEPRKLPWLKHDY